MIIKRLSVIGTLFAVSMTAVCPVQALSPEPGAVFVRVIDVGPGLACVAKIPGEDGDDHYMIYDAGHWNTDNAVLAPVQDIVPEDEDIDLMVDQAIKALETEDQPNASMLRTCLEVLKANDVDVNALEEKTHQPGHSLAGIKLPFDAEGNRVN